MAGLLAGRLALVTGGGSGIGRAVCQVFAREGAKVAVVDRNGSAAQDTATLLGDDSHAFSADVSSSASVSDLLSSVTQQFSQVPSVCVNSAGITKDNFLVKMDEESFDQVINVNLKGTFLVTQAAGKLMIENEIKHGSIVNIASIVGKVGSMGQCNYAASKSGVEGFTKTAAKEMAKFGIRCNSVLPGFIKTPMTDAVPDKVVDMMVNFIPMSRMGTPEEIANAVLFLASERSSYITGISLEVAGGLHM